MNSKITLLAVVLAIGAAMIIATPNVALAKAPKQTTEETEEPINGGITAEITTTTTCANPSERNGPQSENCPNEYFETTTTDCTAVNPAEHEPAGQQKNCPE
jgi:hypothetical protein